MLVVVEGVDGAGKSLLIAQLQRGLRANTVRLVDHLSAEIIEMCVASLKRGGLSVADRAHLDYSLNKERFNVGENIIKPMMRLNLLVLADRWLLSHRFYQSLYCDPLAGHEDKEEYYARHASFVDSQSKFPYTVRPSYTIICTREHSEPYDGFSVCELRALNTRYQSLGATPENLFRAWKRRKDGAKAKDSKGLHDMLEGRLARVTSPIQLNPHHRNPR